MKTIAERVHEIAGKENIEQDCIEKLIWAAYHMGREDATFETANRYRKVLREQKDRAYKVRYYKMAMNVQGHIFFLEDKGYKKEMTKRFRKEKTGF